MMFVDGVWRAASERQSHPVVNPANGDVIDTIPLSTLDDCSAAVDAAVSAFDAWSQTAPRDRSDLLYEAWRSLTARTEELAELIVAENGKTMDDASAEVVYALDFLRWFAEEAVRIRGDYRRAPRGDKRIIVDRVPVGPALLITPWNYPAAMITRKLGPALAAGCTTIIKPALETPLTAREIVRTFDELGAPKGVINLVTPSNAGPAVDRMLETGEIRKLSFTGSTVVGRILLRASAEHVVKTSMELGGNAPFLVLESASIDEAVEGAIQAKLRNGGAACTAANRLYVHRSLVSEFADRLSARVSSFRVGSGDDRTSTVGALVSAAEVHKIRDLIARGKGQGARVVFESEIPEQGAFMNITVLKGIESDNVLTQQEIFGPVFPIVEFDDEEEAVRLANMTEYGLVAYVFGSEVDAMRVGHRLKVGMVGVNRGVVSDAAAPFGGVKESGIGREGSFEGLDEYLQVKYLAVSG
ncbi:NAD-dependent succinate-semialdehyde dehydrogenase [Microbacterium pseudoresistens]|uniref:Succinate-semialdehyde dehydrogenase/glutarate-semialdehyde dehydrogenase n=1 Tax=Microbacterium pseudoresistens TaxID=640634 RepID=A0A7Y9EUT9_9MICO|nr:NAD-dependent succinate-semialdehyde dehydrogenase [Microbacterium pseudoresistens]NYD54372.1 succinate-semialdehyde dehydrogenase/glutarate-semialdehyde dehydrogenase [Microbacterium pseudoresistens]